MTTFCECQSNLNLFPRDKIAIKISNLDYDMIYLCVCTGARNGVLQQGALLRPPGPGRLTHLRVHPPPRGAHHHQARRGLGREGAGHRPGGKERDRGKEKRKVKRERGRLGRR